MQATSGFVRARSGILAAGALSVLLALGGCGGGGGGAGGGLVGGGGDFTYPSSLATATSVNGFISPYAIDDTGSSLVSVETSVFGQSPSSGGKITITVGDMNEKSSGTPIEPGFVVTLDPSAMPDLLSNSPLDSLSPSCMDCLKTGTALDNHGDTVTFIYLDPDPAKSGLTYSTLGMWTKDITGSPDWSKVGGAFSAGVLTRGIDLPTTGSAQYNGYFIGTYTTSDDQTTPSTHYSAGSYFVGANAAATANFVARTVTFSTSNTYISTPLMGPIRESRLDIPTSAPMAITPGSSSFKGGGNTLTNGFGMGATGEIAGGFYGQPDTATGLPSSPPELGGSLSIGNTAPRHQSLVGSFALRKTSSTP